MSKNFELMRGFGRRVGPSAVAESGPVPVKVSDSERGHKDGFVDWSRLAREDATRLVRQLFLLPTQKVPRAVLVAGINKDTASGPISFLVAEALQNAVVGSVCIVEANLRSPSLPRLLGVDHPYGLTDALIRDGAIRSFARPLQTENLWLLSSGSISPDSPTLLGGERIKDRFEELRKEFDYLIVAAPSLTEYADAKSLVRITDGLILVLEANSTRKETALRVIEHLRSNQINVLGAVLNHRTFPVPEVLYKTAAHR
jgi:Mrp family chromosome partitioning ATPase